MAANGFIAVQGAVSALDYLTGRVTGLETEWAAKAQAGDPQPKTTYLMLLTQVVSDAQAADIAALASTEASGTGYARQPVPWGPASAETRTAATTDLIQFGPFPDASGLAAPVTGAALVTRMTTSSAQPAGLCLMAWNLEAAITTQQNQALQIAAGSLTMTLAVT